MSVDELYPEPEPEPELELEDIFEVVDVQLSNKEIREKAEAAGIEDFATARINTLKAQLGV